MSPNPTNLSSKTGSNRFVATSLCLLALALATGCATSSEVRSLQREVAETRAMTERLVGDVEAAAARAQLAAESADAAAREAKAAAEEAQRASSKADQVYRQALRK